MGLMVAHVRGEAGDRGTSWPSASSTVRGDNCDHFSAGPALRYPHAGEGAGRHRDRGRRPRARDRREHGDVQHRQRGAPEASAIRRSRAPRPALHEHAAVSRCVSVVSEFPGLAAAEPLLRFDGGVPLPQLQPHGQRDARALARANDVGGHVRHARRAADSGPHVQRRRGPPRRRPRRRSDVELLADPFRRRPARAGPQSHVERPALYDHRRCAGATMCCGGGRR